MKLLERRKRAIIELERQLKQGTKPTKLSAPYALSLGLQKYDGKFREPLSPADIDKKLKEIETLKKRVA